MINEREELLIEKFIKGDKSVFNEIYRIFYKTSYFNAYYYLKDKAKAEDAVQDAFVEVYNSIGDLKSIKSFDAWLSRVIFSKCHRMVRNKSTKMIVDMGEDFDLESFSNEMDDVMLKLNKKSLSVSIAHAINDLPNQQKEIAILRFYNDFSLKEISEILQVPEGTVKSRISRTKKILQKSLIKRNITPATALSIVATPSLLRIFQALEQCLYAPQAESFDIAKMGSAVDTAAMVKEKAMFTIDLIVSHLKPVMASAVFAVAITINDAAPVSGSTATIEQITFQDAYTNAPMEIKVMVKDEEAIKHITISKDEMNYSLQKKEGYFGGYVEENGKYEVVVESKNGKIETSYFNVQNFDYDAPVIKSAYYDQKNQSLMIEAEDEHSSVDALSVILQVGEEYMQASYQEESGKYIIPLSYEVSGNLIVEDAIGNQNIIPISLLKSE